MSAPEIQVVIPAYNAAADIGACLVALRRAGFDGPGDVVVVDDGSADRTAEIARAAGAHVLETPENAGAAAARNLGARHCTAPIILFVDSDVVVAPDVRKRVIAAFQSRGTDAVFGAYDANPAAPGLVSQYRNLLHRHVHLAGPDAPRTFWTGLGAVRRAAYNAVGGFDPGQRMMEDVEFGLRLTEAGHTIRLDPHLNGQHRKHWTLGAMIRMDLLNRAIPWTRLLGRHGLTRELNLSLQSRVSALLALAVLLCLPFLPFYGLAWGLAAVALAGFVICNMSLLQSLAAAKGPAFAIAAMGPHLVHTWCAIAGFAWVKLAERGQE